MNGLERQVTQKINQISQSQTINFAQLMQNKYHCEFYFSLVSLSCKFYHAHRTPVPKQ